VTITVKNLEEACSLFKEKGAKLVGEVLEVPGHVRMQTFVDGDGNTMQLVQKIS
jgi:predicted enzyme related to lactoylglutathione lyase